MDLDARVPAWYAAQKMGVSRQLFNWWRRTGKVTPGEDGLYRLGDVLEVERQTAASPLSRRHNPVRTGGQR